MGIHRTERMFETEVDPFSSPGAPNLLWVMEVRVVCLKMNTCHDTVKPGVLAVSCDCDNY